MNNEGDGDDDDNEEEDDGDVGDGIERGYFVVREYSIRLLLLFRQR